MILIYNTQTGLINSWSTNYPPVELPPLCDTFVVEGELANPASYYVSGLELVPLPEKPGPWAVWNGTEWIDPRTPADLEAELHTIRSSTSLTKVEFLVSCMSCGLLTPIEAAEAAQGLIPAPFAVAINSMSPEERDTLSVVWPSVTRIERLDPFILLIANSAGISPETLDMVFGLIPFNPAP